VPPTGSAPSRCIPDQPTGVHDDRTFAAAAPKVATLAQRMVTDDRVDAVIISCAADPGLELARAACGAPVVGAGSAAAEVALRQGSHVGVLDLTEQTPAAVTQVLGDRLLNAIVPDGVRQTRDLLTPQGSAAAEAGACALVDQGADVILLACTGMTSIGLADRLAHRVNVPIVDAVLAGGAAVTRLS
jgi:allantoin racemase